MPAPQNFTSPSTGQINHPFTALGQGVWAGASGGRPGVADSKAQISPINVSTAAGKLVKLSCFTNSSWKTQEFKNTSPPKKSYYFYF